MGKWIYLLITILLTFSCVTKDVTIQAITDNKIYEKKVPKNIEDFELFILFNKVEKITGLTKLKNLKKLYILGMDGITDYSFLTKFSKLEILMLETSHVESFDFLKKLPMLRVLYLDGVTLLNNKIDLVNNTQLEYLSLFNLHSSQLNSYFEINLQNIPDNLRFIDISKNIFIKLSKKLFDKLENVPTIILLKQYYYENEKVLKDYKNIYFGDSKKILPEKYWSDTLLKDPEYRLYETNKLEKKKK